MFGVRIESKEGDDSTIHQTRSEPFNFYDFNVARFSKTVKTYCFAASTMALKALGIFWAISVSTLRFKPIFFFFNRPISWL